MGREQIQSFLDAAFPKKHTQHGLTHFGRMVTDYQLEEWEDCIGRSGKFVEATVKALNEHTAGKTATGREFKVDSFITGLMNLPSGSYTGSIRLTIPRACRYVYDIASNRGGRHDADEIDPNEMDASVVMSCCSWILAEMIRYSQKGASKPDEVMDSVRSLMRKKYPFIEDIGGRLYFHEDRKSATDVALVLLAYRYPGRMDRQGLIDQVKRNGFSGQNARIAVKRIMRMVDVNHVDELMLLAPGLKRAEAIRDQVASSFAKN